MRVLMLGWEFPPTITGGLGTACAGLVRAMDEQGIDVDFILPEPDATPPPLDHAMPAIPYFAPQPEPPPPPMQRVRRLREVLQPSPQPEPVVTPSREEVRTYEHVAFHTIPVQLSPYQSEIRTERVTWQTQEIFRYDGAIETPPPAPPTSVLVEEWVDEPVNGHHPATPSPSPPAEAPRETGLFADVKRFTKKLEALAESLKFDVIHAHDWMTFPAGLAIAARTGRPLIVHVHSTETDRAGHNGDSRIEEIERRGTHGAVRVIAVSQFTKDLIVHRYGVSPDKVDVVYNAVEAPPDLKLAADEFTVRKHEKLVLFMGRLTSQKGPEYFLTAAKKVLEVMDDVKFVMAGHGDMARRTVELAAMFGIAHKVLFTGFLRGLDVERIFQIADLFVMPSVSEPFGIAPLEAVVRQVPTIISKQSGVSEVLKHALKVDFWDTNELANKIVAVLRHPTLASMMRADAERDVAKLSWPAAAKQCVAVYKKSIAAMP